MSKWASILIRSGVQEGGGGAFMSHNQSTGFESKSWNIMV